MLYSCADVVRFSFWWHPLLHSIGQFRIWIRIRNTVTINYLVGSGSGKKKTRTQSASSALFAILFSTQEILRFNISIKITTGKKKNIRPLEISWNSTIMNGKAVGTYILTFYLFISYFRGTPLLPEVRNCNQRLCAFVPHCPAAFWTELTRNLPNVHHRIVDTCTRPASGPADPAGFYSALQVYSGTGTLWGLSCKRACTIPSKQCGGLGPNSICIQQLWLWMRIHIPNTGPDPHR